MRQLVTLRDHFLDVFFPKVCEHCGDRFKNGLSNLLCLSCFDQIKPYQEPVCDHCGVSLPARAFEDAIELRCHDCEDWPYYLDSTWSLGAYEGSLRLAHHAFKFDGMEHLKTPIVQKMLANIPAGFWQGIEALVPVPMNSERERERGYNPAFLLASELSTSTAIEIAGLLRKSASTVSQRSLTRTERLKNQKGTFETVQPIALKKVVLVDDVFTTGATLEECAKVLKKGGVEWVGAVVWGRTPLYGSDRASR